MKAPYFIVFARNVIVVTRKFRDAASQMDTKEYETMANGQQRNEEHWAASIIKQHLLSLPR